MQATIVTEVIIRKYLFCPFYHETQDKMHFKRSIVTKKHPPSHDPLKYHTVGGGLPPPLGF